jgi:hypothetical protein
VKAARFALVAAMAFTPFLNDPRPAFADEDIVLFGDLMGRNGEWASVDAGIGYALPWTPFGHAATVPFVLIGAGLGGTSASLGVLADLGPCITRMPIFNCGAAVLNAKLLRTRWLSLWPRSTLAGGEFGLSWFGVKGSLAVLADTANPSTTYLQLSLGVALELWR